jgi:hypothetical protein
MAEPVSFVPGPFSTKGVPPLSRRRIDAPDPEARATEPWPPACFTVVDDSEPSMRRGHRLPVQRLLFLHRDDARDVHRGRIVQLARPRATFDRRLRSSLRTGSPAEHRARHPVRARVDPGAERSASPLHRRRVRSAPRVRVPSAAHARKRLSGPRLGVPDAPREPANAVEGAAGARLGASQREGKRNPPSEGIPRGRRA